VTEIRRPKRARPTDEDLDRLGIKERQAAVRRSLRARNIVDRERAARTHRLVVLGATVESFLGESVDNSVLAGICRTYRDAMANPETAAGMRELGRASIVERNGSAKRWYEARFSTRPTAAVRKALLAEFWRYDSDRRTWKGQAPTPTLEMAIRDAGGLLAPLPRGSSV
jgi:hypothetical protein